LLVDYVANLAVSLEHAELMVREGRLAEAIFAYLEVLDVDPENAEARRQVGLVAAAVRSFDSAPPGKRRYRRPGWSTGVWLVIVLLVLLLGFVAGMEAEHWIANYQAEQSRQGEDQ
jgi:hypothetical protein